MEEMPAPGRKDKQRLLIPRIPFRSSSLGGQVCPYYRRRRESLRPAQASLLQGC
jgi:hypothetical protein